MTADTGSVDAVVAALSDTAPVPRHNGEPVFEAPWQSRAFGMVVTLHERGMYPWESFKALLIEEIAATRGDGGQARTYYEHWVAAFGRLLVDRAVLTSEQLTTRTAEFRRGDRRDDAGPPGVP